jgi:serine/threonine protein kinase
VWGIGGAPGVPLAQNSRDPRVPRTVLAVLPSLRETLDIALGAQYTIQRLLGRGGMGEVYLALDRSLGRLVAIKILSADVASAPAYRERFRREARIVAQLSHPNIVPLYAYGEVDGLWYYVMGYVPGNSLAERLAFEGPLPGDAVRRIVADLADALDYAHRTCCSTTRAAARCSPTSASRSRPTPWSG